MSYIFRATPAERAAGALFTSPWRRGKRDRVAGWANEDAGADARADAGEEKSMAERYGQERGGYYGGSPDERSTSWTSVTIGWLSALGTGLILSGVISGLVAGVAGAGGSTDQAGTVGVVGLLITLFVAFLVGGYTAGRLAGRSGTKHGLLVALLALIVTIILVLLSGIVGAALIDNLRGITLPGVPEDIARQGLNTVLTLSSVLALILPFIAGAIGGSRGAYTGSRRP